MERFKVLHLIKSLGRGGAEMLLPETLKLHDQTRFEFHYIYFLPWKDQMVGEITSAGGAVKCLSASNNVQLILKFWDVSRYIRKNGIQLIHCHLPWAGFLGRIIHRFIGVPVIYTEHNKQERYHKLTRMLNRLTFNWQNSVVAVSKDVKDSVEGNIRVKVPIRKIHNGVNTDYFIRDKASGERLRNQLQIPDGYLIVGSVSVFRSQKRLDKWLEVFASVVSGHPNVVGILIGSGPLKEMLQQKVQELGLSSKVIMPGLITDIKPWLSAIDVFMMTSIFEGLPIALLEAMSMECVIATTDAGGIKEVVVNNQNGIMVSVDSWQQLPQQLSHLIGHPELRLKLAQEARRRIVDHFGMRQMVEELEDLYSGYASLLVERRETVINQL